MNVSIVIRLLWWSGEHQKQWSTSNGRSQVDDMMWLVKIDGGEILSMESKNIFCETQVDMELKYIYTMT